MINCIERHLATLHWDETPEGAVVNMEILAERAMFPLRCIDVMWEGELPPKCYYENPADKYTYGMPKNRSFTLLADDSTFNNVRTALDECKELHFLLRFESGDNLRWRGKYIVQKHTKTDELKDWLHCIHLYMYVNGAIALYCNSGIKIYEWEGKPIEKREDGASDISEALLSTNGKDDT